eukprot:353141-Chlamydomonas_euryale.AAC.8
MVRVATRLACGRRLHRGPRSVGRGDGDGQRLGAAARAAARRRERAVLLHGRGIRIVSQGVSRVWGCSGRAVASALSGRV